jgi:hypothetical protein
MADGTVGFSRYARLLRVPGALVPAVVGTLARLPIGMTALALLLAVQRESGSFAEAGAASAAFSIALAATAPVRGSGVDRRGAPAALLRYGVAHPVALLACVGAVLGGLPFAVVLLLAAAAGGTFPPVGSVVRSLWGVLFDDEADRTTAYALDAVLTELAFIGGPLFVGLAVTVASPAAAVVLAAACSGAGSVWLGRSPVTARLAAHTGGRAPSAARAAAVRDGAPAAAGAGAAGSRLRRDRGVGRGVRRGRARRSAGRAPARAVGPRQRARGALLRLSGVADAAGAAVPVASCAPRGGTGAAPRRGGAVVARAPAACRWRSYRAVLGVQHRPARKDGSPGATTATFAWSGSGIVVGIALGNGGGGWLVDHVSTAAGFTCAAAAGVVALVTAWRRRGADAVA